MQEKTRKEIILDLIKELSENYSVNEATVIEQLCSSLSEVLSEQFPYKVETFFKDAELFFIGRTYQHGKEIDVTLSVSKLKHYHFKRTCLILIKKLDIEEYSQFHLKYDSWANKIVYGHVTKIIDNRLIIAVNGIDIPGICDISEMFEKNRKDVLNKTLAFYVKRASEERVERRSMFILVLNRISIRLPALLLKHLAQDDELVIKSIRRIPGKVSYLRSNKPVKMKILLKAEKELQEAIRIRPMSREVVNDRP